MAWIKLKSSVTNNIITMPESAYNNFHKNSQIFTIIEEQPKKEENKRSKLPKEEIENGESLQLSDENEINPSGKNKKKTGV